MNWKRYSPGTWSPLTRVLVAFSFALAVTVIVIGLDNVPGLVTGMTAATCLIIVRTYRWRRIRRFLLLAAGSLLVAVFLSGIYTEIAQPLVLRLGGPPVLESGGWMTFENIISYLILLVAPGCITVGLTGAFVLAVSRLRAGFRRHRTAES